MQQHYCHLPAYSASLAYCVEGDQQKPVLLFVHGVAESKTIWHSAIQILKADFYCIAVDLPGHGDSSAFRGNWSMSFFAQVIRAFIETMQFHQVTLIAHSMGAQISCIAALQMPSHITELVLAAPAGIETFTPKEAQLLNAWTEANWQQPPSTSLFAQQLAKHFSNFTSEINQFTEELSSFYHPSQIDAFREAVVGSIRGMLAEPIHQYLSQLQQRIYVLIGSNDLLVPNRILHPQLTPQQILTESETLLKHCKTQLITGAGHFFPLEFPKKIAEAVIELKAND